MKDFIYFYNKLYFKFKNEMSFSFSKKLNMFLMHKEFILY